MTVIQIKETKELVESDELLSDVELGILQAVAQEGSTVLETDFDVETRAEGRAALARLERRGLVELTAEGWVATEKSEERLLQHDDVVRAKWSMDGAGTLSEAAAKLREYADHLEVMAQEGWVLNEPVQDDYGFLRRSKETLAATQTIDPRTPAL